MRAEGTSGTSASPLRRYGGLALLLLAAFAVRLIHIDRSLWLDEGLSLARGAELDAMDGQRPLYFLFLRLWTKTGTSEIWLRFPSVLFGVAAVGVLFLLAERLSDRRVAYVAAALMSLSTSQIWHSQEVRMYSLSPLLMLSAAYTLLRWIDLGTRRAMAAHVLCAYLALLCHPFSLPGLVSMTVLAALQVRRIPGRVRTLALAYSAVFLAWSPFLFLAATHPGADWITRPELIAYLKFHSWSFSYFNRSVWLRRFFSLVILGCIGVSVVTADARGRIGRRFAIWFYAATVPIFVASLFVKPMWVPRYFTSYSPALFFLVALGLVALHDRIRWVSLALGAGIAAFQVLGLGYLDTITEDWRGVAAHIQHEAKRGDGIAVIGVGPPPVNVWTYYSPDRSSFITVPEVERFSGAWLESIGSSEATKKSQSRLWFVVRVSGNEDRPASIMKAIEGKLETRSENFPGILVLEARPM